METGSQKPHIVGIVGASCAGKSWLADRLHEALGKAAGRLSLDDFYLDRSYLSTGQRKRVNFDHPRSIDWERLKETLLAFLAGKPARVPRYNFSAHSRDPEETLLPPAAVIIMDGLWLFRRPDIRQLFATRVFVKSDAETCLKRRLDRDARARGRTEDEILAQVHSFVLPMQRRYVDPQERWAEFVYQSPIDENLVQQLAERVKTKIPSKTLGV